jgi:DNA-binding SARP family transcriptional activator/tetratricopeptide (TPR) repeat protein
MQYVYAEALRVKGLNLFRLGRARQAGEYMKHSLALYTALNDTGSIPSLMMETGMVQQVFGDIEAAKTLFLNARKIWQAEKNFFSLAGLMNNLANLYHQTGEYDLAAEAFENGLSYARRSRYPRAEALILLGLGDLYAEVGEYESAALAYQKAEPMAREFAGSFIDIYLSLARANLAVQQGDSEKAYLALRTAKKKLGNSLSIYERALYKLIKGRIHLLNNQARKAITLLEDCKAGFLTDGREMETLWSRVWLAAALHQGGELDAAREQIREIFSQRIEGSHALVVMLKQAGPWLGGLRSDPQIGRTLSGALERVRRFEANLPTVRRVLRRSAQSIQMSVASLVAHAFGRAEVHVDGRAVTMPEWSTQSVRDLLFYFLHKHDAVTKEQIADALWPGIDDPQILKQRFKTYIFRLRRATRRDVIVFDEEYYRFNHKLDYEYDVEAFENYLARARAAREDEERMENFSKAVDLVRGPYLADVDATWAQAERQRLEQACLVALEELAKLYLNANRLEQAISICQRIFLTDIYRESAYQVSMQAHAARGERNAVVHQYQACRSALHELGLSPSKETQALYYGLTN